MNCTICETEILHRDSWFRQYENEVARKAKYNEGGVHDDCLLREFEFAGEYTKAGEIFRESKVFYKRIAEIARDFPQG